MITNNGGASITTYSIELDDGTGGDFVAVCQDLALTCLVEGMNRGSQYRARYRTLNAIGWSEYSPIGYLLAASVPARPEQPKF